MAASSALPRQRAGRGLRPQGPAPAGPGLPLRRPRLDRAPVRVLLPHEAEAQGRRQDADRRRVHADARRQAAPPDARPRPDRARRRRLDRGRAVRRAGRDKLRAAKFRWTVRIKDLDKRVEQNRKADRRYAAAQAGGSALPSGRTTYRHLADYELELKTLAGPLPEAGQADHAQPQDPRGSGRRGDRDRDAPVPRVNDGKPIFAEHGHPPRA